MTSLDPVRAEADELVELVDRLDPLGHDDEVQRVSKVDHRLDDGAGVLVGRDVLGEQLVELEDVEREGAQVVERREAGAEVVEHEPDTQIVDVLQDGQGPAAVIQKAVLRHLQRQV